jgi:neutral amino acid transport system substrate-binding protein
MVVVAGLAAPSALAACSSGDNTAVIGVASPQSGEAAVWGGPVDTITRAVVKDMNKLGGIKGTKLRVVTEDEKFNAEDGVRVVTKLINNDHAQFILGPTSPTFMATLGTAKRNKVAIASPYSGIVEFDQKSNPYTFRTVGPDTFDGLVVAKNIWDQGFKTLAILYENSDSAKSTASWVKQSYTKLGGKVVDETPFSAGQSSYLPEVQKTFKNKPDMVFLASSSEAAVPILREWARMAVPGHWSFISELTLPDLLQQVGASRLEGAFGETPIAADSPAVKQMRDLLAASYGAKKADEIMAIPTAGTSYDAIVAALLAMYAGGEATGSAVAEHLHEVTDSGGTPVYSLAEGVKALKKGEKIDYQGASGPVDFSKTGTAASDYGVWQVVGGKWTVVHRYSGKELFDLAKSVGD